MTTSLRSEYMLDPTVTYLNHGSFGACPRAVFESWQGYQRRLESNPVRFLSHEAGEMLHDARRKLAAYLGAEANNLILTTNPTHAFAQISRTVPLQPGDEILATDQEYPAMERGWEYIAHKTGARYLHQPLPLPLSSREEFIETFWAGVTERTRVIHLSHIVAGLALILPVEEICRRARERGILTVIDGAHAPSQLDLNLERIGADYYFGACHKWLSAPKGTGFLYANPRVQDKTEPLVVSSGWLKDEPAEAREDGLSRFVALNTWQGTRDPSAFLAIPSAIDFQTSHDWANQKKRCHALAAEARGRLLELSGLEPFYPDSEDFYCQMVTVPVGKFDPGELSRRLWEEYRIIVIVGKVGEFTTLRLSFQAYNEEADIRKITGAMAEVLARPQ